MYRAKKELLFSIICVVTVLFTIAGCSEPKPITRREAMINAADALDHYCKDNNIRKSRLKVSQRGVRVTNFDNSYGWCFQYECKDWPYNSIKTYIDAYGGVDIHKAVGKIEAEGIAAAKFREYIAWEKSSAYYYAKPKASCGINSVSSSMPDERVWWFDYKRLTGGGHGVKISVYEDGSAKVFGLDP